MRGGYITICHIKLSNMLLSHMLDIAIRHKRRKIYYFLTACDVRTYPLMHTDGIRWTIFPYMRTWQVHVARLSAEAKSP